MCMCRECVRARVCIVYVYKIYLSKIHTIQNICVCVNVDYTGYFGWLANNNSKWLAAFSSLSPLIKFNYLMTVEMWIKNK